MDVPALPPAPDQDHERATDGEMDDRRLQVLRLRNRRMSITQIGAALHVDPSTISRDLKWIRQHWKEMLGDHPKFDASVFIGESLAVYDDIETQAMFESSKAGTSVGNKMRCLQVATYARDKKVQLMQDIGMIGRAPVNLNVNLPTAEQIRKAIQNAQITIDGPDIIDVAS
jgi:hypothetical protein